MKEFWTYTLLRLGLFVGTFAIVFGLWFLITGDVPVLWVIVIAFVVSGVGSYFLLERQREAFAAKVEGRAAKAAERFEAQKSKEDAD
ncbi:DUF4229 domain-containing protein [Nocardioides silvaticus]|uniref:DUF4229 domain-containing protein n=1 Tax=Nocardioides silvaticus TaxID=2201891 RepID=A0A316TC54_9ACTN|nr:DUF4229 domain-containing protein [Nocardioides silvaticus]PWN01953.1 DUF4229 domain-containing protein [Nocardioides silvaticus]